jgi:amidase
VKELWAADASRQVAMVAAGEVSCRELVEAHLARIERLNPQLGAVTVTLDESALKLADAADRSGESGRLRGLPFTVKEDIDCLGSPTTHGVPALRHALPYVDAPVVARLKAAGAIPIARTNLSEMGLRLCTSNPLHGRTLNPHDRKLTVGGSSGGDAAAVCTGMTPLGIGGDSGGSLRVPAACCGCVTLKPTTGRIAHASSLPPEDYGLALQWMLAIGPLARSVQDLRLILDVVSGRDPRDPRSVDVPFDGPKPRDLVAGIVSSLPGAPLPAPTTEAIRRAGAALEAAGWAVEEVMPPELATVDAVFTNLLADELGVLARQLEPVISESLFQHLERLSQFAQSRAIPRTKLATERSRLIRQWSNFFASYPVVIGPNLGCPIWPVDADLDPTTGIELLERATRFIAPGNALGIPSLALPMGTAGGLPTSVLIYSDLWREDLCLEAAAIIEAEGGSASVVEPAWSARA